MIERPSAIAQVGYKCPTIRRCVGGTDGSAIATGHLLRETINPAQSSGQSAADRTSKQSSNALGEVIRSTDPAGGGDRIDTTYSTAGRVVLREVHTFAQNFDTAVKSIETTYDGMGRLSRARSLSSSSATLNDEVFAYDGWGNLSQTTVDADSAYDASSGTPPMVTTMTWTRNTTASGWQRLRQATVEQPGGASARYKVDGDTISQAMGRISHIQENLTGSGAVLADYRYMGASAAVAAVLPEASIGTRLYYFNGGSAQYDEYMDRFNRVLKNQWQKVNSPTNAPVFVEFKPAYDRGGLVTSVEDTIFGSGLKDGDTNPDFTRAFDQFITRDALKRVTKQEEGQLNSGRTAIVTGKMSRQQILERDLRGRVTTNKVDLNGDNDFADGPLGSADGGEMNDTRSFFHAQTLLTRSVIDKDRPGTAVTPVYDRNGNLSSDGEKHVYRYNPWCQLVEVQAYGVWPIKVLARYSYTATGQRVTEEYDTNADGAVTASDVMTIIASDTSGRRVASFVDHGDFFAKETFFHHPPHIRGPGFAGGPIVRDRNEDLVDPNRWKRAATEERLERRYYATDWQGRVVSLVTAAGEKAEDYRYSATGVPFGIPLGDVNADGKVDGGTTGADYTLAFDQEDGGVYDARVDLNLDQVLDSTDVAMVAGQDGVATGRGELSASGVSSRLSHFLGAEWRSSLGLLMQASERRFSVRSGCMCTSARSLALDGIGLQRCFGHRRLYPDYFGKNVMRVVCRDTIGDFDHCFIVCYGRDGKHVGCRGGPHGPGSSPNSERPGQPCASNPNGIPVPFFGPLRSGCWDWFPGGQPPRRNPGDTDNDPDRVFPDLTPLPDPVFGSAVASGGGGDPAPAPARDVKYIDFDDPDGSICDCIQRQIRYYDCRFWYGLGNSNSNSVIGSALRCCMPRRGDFPSYLPEWFRQAPGFEFDLGCEPKPRWISPVTPRP
ncbi:MAG: hypothetical protein ACK5WB_03870 [Phycisphaerales bacterium]